MARPLAVVASYHKGGIDDALLCEIFEEASAAPEAPLEPAAAVAPAEAAAGVAATPAGGRFAFTRGDR